MNFRCGYCGTPGKDGRCTVCGSGMDNEDRALEGAKRPDLIKRWLRSNDRGWKIVDSMREELHLRYMEDDKEGRNWKRFDGVTLNWEEKI